ncbi:SHOCT domain-containing protein [Streptomyces sp. NPDC047108]|uniref:SHOCT domain-containing protein n=1 Tax=Streptomyces sp. NPDC047108 TaxID=3155025 RepID=UPI0033DC4F26
MDWSDLADIAFDRLGDSSNRVESAVDDTAVPGEAPLAVTSARARQDWTNGALVLTTHRLLYVKEGRAPVPVPLPGITDVQVAKSRLTGQILKVTAVSGAHSWENVTDSEAFADTLRTAVKNAAEFRSPAAGSPDADIKATGSATPQQDPSWVDRIERLADLHGRGALTDEEFAMAKRKLIDG